MLVYSLGKLEGVIELLAEGIASQTMPVAAIRSIVPFTHSW